MSAAEFLTASPESHARFAEVLAATAQLLERAWPARSCSGATPDEIAAMLPTDVCPEHGMPLSDALRQAECIVQHSVRVGRADVAAHLQCAPLLPAVAAEVVLSALNQSMDSFDQAPAATMVELQLTAWLCRLAGLPATAAGSFTSGGTQSNAMGLWIARDAHLAARGWSVRERGLPPDADRLVFVCSEVAHFTVDKCAIQLGLGTNAVVKVPVDRKFAMAPRALRETLARIKAEGRTAIAIVATVGTTDHGAIDPLHDIADAARDEGAWMHIDAAYGGGLLLSSARRQLLTGIERADSIGIDGHKLFWQPASCGVFLLRDANEFRHLVTHADYLNPEEHVAQGVPDLVNRSLLTTRRFDAFKLWLTLQTVGRRALGDMIDATCRLAAEIGQKVAEEPALELVHVSDELSTVLFRYRPGDAASVGQTDVINQQIRDTLFARGTAVIGTTRVHGRLTLKLTVLHPLASVAEFTRLLADVVACGRALEGR
jgi:L-2,4-diaminobutyrate decarboxylase